MKKLLLIPALLCALASCVDKDYDYRDGFDKSMTLFSDEMTVPLGKMDSISLGSFLKENKLEFTKMDSEGYYYADQTKDCFQTTGLEIYYNHLMNKASTDFSPKDVKMTVSPSSSSIVEMSMSNFAHQQVEMIFDNPFNDYDITISFDMTADTSTGETVNVGSVSKQVCKFGKTTFKFDLEGVGSKIPKSINVTNIKISVPESIYNDIMKYTMTVMTMKCHFKTGFEMPDMTMIYAYPVEIDQQIAKYHFKEIELVSDIVSTVPVTAKVHEFYFIDGDGKKDTDVTLEASQDIAPGTLAQPTTTKFKAVVKCDKGFPDLKKIFVSFDIITEKDIASGQAINDNQCVVMNNSYIVLKGGITVCGE